MHPHGVLSLHAWCSFCTEACNFSQLFPGIDMHVGKPHRQKSQTPDLLCLCSVDIIFLAWWCIAFAGKVCKIECIVQNAHERGLAACLSALAWCFACLVSCSAAAAANNTWLQHYRDSAVELPLSYCERAYAEPGAGRCQQKNTAQGKSLLAQGMHCPLLFCRGRLGASECRGA